MHAAKLTGIVSWSLKELFFNKYETGLSMEKIRDNELER